MEAWDDNMSRVCTKLQEDISISVGAFFIFISKLLFKLN